MINIASVFFLKIFFALFTLFSIYIVSAIFGVEGVSFYGVALAIINIASTIIVLGGNVAAVNNHNKKIKNNGLWQVVIINGFLGVVVCALLFYYTKDYRALMVFASFPVAILTLIASIYYVKGRPLAAVLVGEGVKAIIPLSVLFILIALKVSNNPQFIITSAYSCLFIIVAMLPFSKDFKVLDFKLNITEYIIVAKKNFIIFVPMLLIVLSQQLDRVILSFYVSDYDLASLFAAQTVLSLIFISIHAAVSVNLPVLSKVAEVEKGNIVSTSRQIFVFVFVLSLISLPANWLYSILINGDKEVILHIYLIMLSGVVLSFIFGVGQSMLQYTNNKKYYMKLMLFTVILQYFLFFLLLAPFGVYAAPVAFSISIFVSRFLAYIYWYKKRVNIAIWENLK